MISYAPNVYYWRPSGVRGLTMDGTGLFGTGLLGTGTWDWTDYLTLGLGGLAIYSLFSNVIGGAKQTKLEAELQASKYRKKRASRLREKAKKLEAQGTGFGGLLF